MTIKKRILSEEEQTQLVQLVKEYNFWVRFSKVTLVVIISSVALMDRLGISKPLITTLLKELSK